MEEPEVKKLNEKEESLMRRTITLKIVESKMEWSSRRFNYLSKRLAGKKPPASPEYWDQASRRISGILKQVEKFFQLENLAHVDMDDVKSRLCDLLGEIGTQEWTNQDDLQLRTFWNLEAKEFFGELFQLMEENFEFILRKFEEKYYIEEDAIDYIHQKIKKYAEGVFS